MNPPRGGRTGRPGRTRPEDAQDATRGGGRPLGCRQEALMRSLCEHKAWYPICGWTWGGWTERVLDSLTRRGLVIRHESVTLTGQNYGGGVNSYEVGPYYHRADRAGKCPKCCGRGKASR